MPRSSYLSREMYSLLALMPKVGIAVSGGSDSVALLHIMLDAFGADKVHVLHFDHNLRDASASDAQWVADLCKSLSVPCTVKVWADAKSVVDDNTNLMQAARKARYQFFNEQVLEHDLDAVLVGHTQDDVAETFLMRLGKGSGLQGLSAMRAVTDIHGCRVMRPLLDQPREALQECLADKGQDYLSDPSNENETFLRPRVRALKSQLEAAGIPFSSIAASAASLSRANETVSYFEEIVTKHTVQKSANGITLDFEKLASAPKEIRLRLVGQVICSITGSGLAPRTSKRERLLSSMTQNNAVATLGGVRFERKGSHIVCKVENA